MFEIGNQERFKVPGKWLQVLVITPLRGMLLVYRPEGRGPINRNIPIRGVIIDL